MKDVHNEIQVGDVGGPGRYAKDAWITTRVRTAIIGDKKAKDVNYKVETVNGVVYLMGIARSRAGARQRHRQGPAGRRREESRQPGPGEEPEQKTAAS